MMGLQSPALAWWEIATGSIVQTSSFSPLQQHQHQPCYSPHSANFIYASRVATVPAVTGNSWYRRRKLNNILRIYPESSPGIISVLKLSCRSPLVKCERGREDLYNYRRQSQNVSTFVKCPNYYGIANRRQFPGVSYSSIISSSTKLGTQQPLASRSLEDKAVQGRSKDQDDLGSDTDGELGSIAEFNETSSQSVNSEGAVDADGERRWPVDDEVPLTRDVQNAPPPIRKKKGLGVRKPLQEAEKSDFATRFGLSAQLPASYGEASQPKEAIDVEYYDPKVGDQVLGVIVSGNEFKLDVDIGSQQLGRVLTKDIYPLDLFLSDKLFWELPAVERGQVQELPVGRAGVVRDDEVFCLPAARAPIVEVGSVLRFRVQGVTLSGRPILSSRVVAFPLAWERVRQIQRQNEPLMVHISEWNSGGLLTRIEGLRAFLPLNHLLNRAMGTGALKARVGERIQVLITEVDEQTGKLIISEKRAWGLKNLRPGTLHDGVVNKIFPFGVEVSLPGTSLRGMIHISNVSRSRVKNLEQVFYQSEPVKVMVVKSPIPHRIALSTADLESSKGLILQDKETVFREAEEMAARFRSSVPDGDLEEDDKVMEQAMIETEIANWDWLDFGDETESVESGSR